MTTTGATEPAGGFFPLLGPYVIVRTSGVGGMGRVDLALRTDGEPPEICVLKRMHGGSEAPDQQARFEREARIAARLSHSNIAQSLKVEEIDGELCIAQEYVQGVDLARFMKQVGTQGAPTWAAAHVIREIATALAYAHEFGGQEIVHRDVTPENIMLAFGGDVKLIDFGISRSRVDGTLTNIGMVVGRRAYVPPEAWAGNKVDRRADVFALGVVLWELLTARRLEELEDARWKDSVPDPRTIRAEIAPELAEVTLRAVAPDPGQRFQSAGDLRDALAGFVPTDKDPRGELTALLSFHFNVERAREIVASQIEDARRTLRPSARDTSSRRRRARAAWTVVAVGAIGVAAALSVPAMRRSGPEPGAPGARTAQVVGSPSPRAAAPPTVKPPSIVEQHASAPALPATEIRPTALHDGSGKGRHPARMKVASASPSPSENPDQLLRGGYELFDAGQLAEAQDRARRAIAAGAGARGHLLLGSIYMNRGRLGDAERELEAAVQLNPHDTEAARRLADVRRARQEQGQ